MMQKALHFNPIRENELEFREIESDFTSVEEFWVRTNKGPLVAGEVWRDTPKNREIIDRIIDLKKGLLKVKNQVSKEIYALTNIRER